MNQEQIKLVKQSWKLFRNIEPAIVGDLFYSKLFTDNPQVKKMFPKDMSEQYNKLIDKITVIVIRLEHLELLTDEIAGMAQRHAGYGVKPAHYKLVGDALLWTLEKGLGKDWNSAVKEAWLTCYTLLSNTMIAASEELPAA
jgi:hemoglobin-like flavoprotein